ncbi:hypothetical protein ACWDBO_25695 [Streptomyces mirabilis]|uniref:hypothetical protein n=1 Tax=Streptomyces mirabilis TaxID=68239 RepID=UPI00331F43DE
MPRTLETADGAPAVTESLPRMAAYLHEALLGGAVFLDDASHHVCCLVPSTTPDDWHASGSEYLGKDAYLGVPFPGAAPTMRSHWLVELDAPDTVCLPDAVLQMVTFARFRAATRVNG